MKVPACNTLLKGFKDNLQCHLTKTMQKTLPINTICDWFACVNYSGGDITIVCFFSKFGFTCKKSSIPVKLRLVTLISMALLGKMLQENNEDVKAFYVVAARFCEQSGQWICSRLFWLIHAIFYQNEQDIHTVRYNEILNSQNNTK